jgi:hypothetical protein
MVEMVRGKSKIVSKYRKFLEEEYAYRKLSIYEEMYNFFDKVKVPLPASWEQRFKNEINFCHLKATPNGVFLTSVIVPLVIFALFYSAFYVLHILSIPMILAIATLSVIILYYLFYYTSFLTKYYRTKAAAEMSSAIIYMCISLKINANLESAVAFAASNLSGPLGLDMKKILWDLETGELFSIVSGLDELTEKWKSESEEFVDALSLLKSAINQPPDKMEKNMAEAIDVMLEGTKARMKKYALNMRTPLTILNTFGILLPLLILIFFPVLIVFVPELAKPELIGFSYMVLLPVVTYLFLRQYFFTKPYSYHQVEIKNSEEFKKQQIKSLLFSIAVVILPIAFFSYRLLTIQSLFSTGQFVYSFLIIVCLSFSVILYSFLSSFSSLKKNEEILKIESELPTVLFQLGVISSSGKPIEKNIEDLYPRIKSLKISEIFNKIIYNIRTFGMTLESAIFDKKAGAIISYPSRVISISFEIIVDISKRGMSFLSMALKSMSKYFRDADEVNNAADEILSETTSDMQLQSLIFAPLSAGIVVGLMAIVTYMFVFFGASLQGLKTFFEKTGFGDTGMSAFSFLWNVGEGIPFHVFQIIVGIYMIETVYIISYFLGEINYGDDDVSKLYDLGKTMLIGIVIYSITVCLLFFGMSSLINLSELGVLA